MTRSHSPADRGTYIGLTREAAAVTNAPSGTQARAQDEGLPVQVRNDEAERAAGGGQGFTAQASPFVAASGAEEAGRIAGDPAPAPDARHSRLYRPLACNERLSADYDRITVRLSPREA